MVNKNAASFCTDSIVEAGDLLGSIWHYTDPQRDHGRLGKWLKESVHEDIQNDNERFPKIELAYGTDTADIKYRIK